MATTTIDGRDQRRGTGGRRVMSTARREALEDRFAPLLGASRRREVLELAKRSPDAAANIDEMAIVKCGSFAPRLERAPDLARVLVWNVERGRAPERWVQIPAVGEADVLLLCEVDDGMARSGNLDIAAELAERLRMFYAYAPNYFELTRGTRSERRATRGLRNARGLHGNAILSRWPLRDVRRLPLPVEFDWFRHGECRIGTRVALRATLQGPRGPITLAVAHLEAFATPAQRARQMAALLTQLVDAPRAMLGGDFNTLGVKPGWLGALRLLGQRARDAHRLTRSVVEHEPLFAEAQGAGFSWEELNSPEPTWCLNRFLPRSCHAKLDWVFGRAVKVERGSTAIVSAHSGQGSGASRPLSDHAGLSLRVWL
jgi:endonuclease/exonuclease/phosphatase family metal-dependent hydrolase